MKSDDLTQFAPQGDGMYGSKAIDGEPFSHCIQTADEGGLVFFRADVEKADLFGMLKVLGMYDGVRTGYKFIDQSPEGKPPGRCLRQLRIVSNFALKCAFEKEPEVPIDGTNAHEKIWAFIEEEVAKYGTMFGSSLLSGLSGGDGDYEQEALGFGFMVENSYFGIYRLWSRAWLCTK